MSEISLPAGAFAAMKAGTPAPAPEAAKVEETGEKPKTITRKAAENKLGNSQNKLENDNQINHEKPPEGMTATEKKIWKLKADGEEFDFDASDEEAIKREIMKARGADKRFDSAAQMRKQAETFFEMIKNPESLKKVLTDPRIGVDLKKFAEDYVWEQIQEAQMTPEQRVQRDKDRKLAEYEAREAKSAEEVKTREQKQKEAYYETSYEQKITKALEIGGIPKTHAAVTRMADYLMKSIEHGYDLTPEDLVQEVRKDYLNDVTSVLSAADGDQLLALIGEANADKLRKADLKRLRSTQSNPFAQRTKSRPDASPAQPKKLGSSEWKDDLVKGFMSRNR